ncbi:hypothetical protein KEM48_005777 [Puccinia striiformis f. sp. tritici PST-130]|nr:hypothetical protein KEM48_005777 [Puccinia striiformis f. sp. tritici PST-130]
MEFGWRGQGSEHPSTIFDPSAEVAQTSLPPISNEPLAIGCPELVDNWIETAVLTPQVQAVFRGATAENQGRIFAKWALEACVKFDFSGNSKAAWLRGLATDYQRSVGVHKMRSLLLATERYYL